MTNKNKEALEILLKTDRIGVNFIRSNDEETNKYNQDSAEALLAAVKALAVVEEIKKAYIDVISGCRYSDLIRHDLIRHRVATQVYDILCEAYGTEDDEESWLKEYQNE